MLGSITLRNCNQMTFMETNVEELLRNLYHCIHTCMYTIIYGYARVGITCIGSICLRIDFAHHGFTYVYRYNSVLLGSISFVYLYYTCRQAIQVILQGRGSNPRPPACKSGALSNRATQAHTSVLGISNTSP